MFTLATIAGLAAAGLLILFARWLASRSVGDRALRDATVSRDWLSRHRAEDRP
jgi:hypothetical protein